uniref:Pyroglutamyl-peptidase I n=1 Tax=Mesocestoides corti TaxID=53468 RepID=A0A5K3F2F3_MESCO
MPFGPKVVVTGFGPFGGVLLNSSTIAVQTLRNRWRSMEPGLSPTIDLIVLPNIEVSYRNVDVVVSEIWNIIKPDLVIHVGVDATSSTIKLETQSGSGPYVLEDVCGLTCDFEDLRGHICTTLSLSEPCALLQSAGYSCCLSTNPGRFLCSYIYHRSLERDPNRTLFVHVPTISEIFTPDYLGDFLLLLIISLCKQCGLQITQSLEDYFRKQTTRT